MSPISADSCSASAMERLHHEGTGIACHQLDEVGLALGAGLREQPMQMRLHGRLGEAQRLRDLWHPADLYDGEQYAQLSRRQPVKLADDLERGGGVQRRLV